MAGDLLSYLIEPIHHLLHDAGHGRPLRVDPDVCLFVGRAPGCIKTLEFDPISRERPAAVNRHARNEPFERQVEPDGKSILEHDRTILRVHERAASRRHNRVTQGDQIEQDCLLGGSEVCLAPAREQLRDRLTFALLDKIVDVEDPPSETPAQGPGDGRFSGAHEPNEIDLVSVHATSCPSVSKKPGYEMTTASAPSM